MVSRRLCSIEGCSKPHKSSGLCGTHYEYASRGSTLKDDSIKERSRKYSHRLSNLDKEALTADCSSCGPVDVYYRKAKNVYACKPAQKAAQEDYILRRKYGISTSDKLAMWEAQGKACAICEKEILLKDAHVDHSHDRLETRGLLCGSCNRGLGMFYEDQETLLKAIAYLRQYE